MKDVIVLRGAVDGSQIYVVPRVALVTPYQEQERSTNGTPIGPPQTIIGEAVVQFFGQPVALRVKGSPGDIAVLISGKETAKELVNG